MHNHSMTTPDRRLMAVVDDVDVDFGAATDEQVEASDAVDDGMGFVLIDLDEGGQGHDWARRCGHRIATAWVTA